jgi:hypothetical protein
VTVRGPGPTTGGETMAPSPSAGPLSGTVLETDAVAVSVPEGMTGQVTSAGGIELRRAASHTIALASAWGSLADLEAMLTQPQNGFVLCLEPAPLPDLPNWPTGIRTLIQCTLADASQSIAPDDVGRAPDPASAGVGLVVVHYYAASASEPPVAMYVLGACHPGCDQQALGADLQAVMEVVRWKLWSN